jgi:type III secretory pathway component EscV
MADKPKTDAAAGVFMAGLALVFIGIWTGYTVWMFAVAALLMVGAVTATARQRRTGPEPEVTLRPGGESRPWRAPKE